MKMSTKFSWDRLGLSSERPMSALVFRWFRNAEGVSEQDHIKTETINIWTTTLALLPREILSQGGVGWGWGDPRRRSRKKRTLCSPIYRLTDWLLHFHTRQPVGFVISFQYNLQELSENPEQVRDFQPLFVAIPCGGINHLIHNYSKCVQYPERTVFQSPIYRHIDV